MIQITPHPTVNEIYWIPGLTTEGNFVTGKNYATQVVWNRRAKDERLVTGVDTIGWVGSWSNPYFSARVLQVADTNYNPLVTVGAVVVERGVRTKF